MAGVYDSEFDSDSDDKSVFPPGRHPVGEGVLEKIARRLSFLGMASYNEEVTPSVENDTVANASYNRTL